MSRCLEIEWKGKGVFAHKGPVEEWEAIVDNPSVTAVRKLQDIEFGEWTGVYEVDRVIGDTGRRKTVQYLVAGEPAVPEGQ